MEESGYIAAELLEFHPDFDTRLKFRGYAYVRPRPELQRPEHAHVYLMCGAGYLDEPYLSVNEVFLHPLDVRELMQWCRQHGDRSLIIHRCPLPFPVFKRGTRVTVITDPENERRFLGQSGTITESSSGGRSGVKFDDGMTWHFDSSSLRALMPGQYQHDVRAIRRKERKQNQQTQLE
jgi:hypothetical protein